MTHEQLSLALTPVKKRKGPSKGSIKKSLVGQRFGRLVVLRPTEQRQSHSVVWECLCDCGRTCRKNGTNLRAGVSRSCGCLQSEETTAKNYKHGRRFQSEWRIWCGMKQRCTNPKCRVFEHYGGRDIYVCGRWMNSFEDFYEDMGPRPPGKSLDRIDNDGPYAPWNCRWATQKEQIANSRPRRKRAT